LYSEIEPLGGQTLYPTTEQFGGWVGTVGNTQWQFEFGEPGVYSYMLRALVTDAANLTSGCALEVEAGAVYAPQLIPVAKDRRVGIPGGAAFFRPLQPSLNSHPFRVYQEYLDVAVADGNGVGIKPSVVWTRLSGTATIASVDLYATFARWDTEHESTWGALAYDWGL
jgi:hypothetical protein